MQPDVDFILEHFKSFDEMTDEQRANSIIDYMVGKGLLTVVSQNPENGESMLDLN